MSRASRIFIGLIPTVVAAVEEALSQVQDQFRFGADDGNEAGHGWIADQNTNISQAGSVASILRIQVDNTGDQPSQQMKLQVKKTSEGDETYIDVQVAP